MYFDRFKERDLRYLDRTERRIEVVTPELRWIHAAQIIQEAYNDFKQGVNDDSRQVTLFYHTIKKYQINLDNQTIHHHAEARGKKAQVKLI